MIELNKSDNISELLNTKKSVLLYFSSDNCSVCNVLKPKIQKNISKNFPKLEAFEINSNKNLELAIQYNIFTSPTILIFFEGKEFKRYGRNISLNIFEEEIKRVYDIIYS